VLFVEHMVFGLCGAMDGQTFGVGVQAGDALGEIFGEEELPSVGDVSTSVPLFGLASDMRFHVDVDGAARVPAGIDRGKFGATGCIG
jgi:hypothetical protein